MDCEIFKAGKHTDSEGRQKTWTEADLDKMVASYNSKEHEAPIVIGHPKTNAPAYGWVDSVKRVGLSLIANFKQVVPEFKKAVNDGLFKKRSISLYPDGSIRHVGFLGAQPPAIKGLADFKFSEQDSQTYEDGFSPAETELFNTEEKNKMTVEELQKQLLEEQAKSKALEAEKVQLQAKAADLEKNFAEAETKRKRTEIEAMINAGIDAGKMLPEWKKAGIVEFMTGLDNQGQTFEFSEGKKQTASEWFKGFITSFSEHPLFKEMSKPTKKSDEATNADLVSLIVKEAK